MYPNINKSQNDPQIDSNQESWIGRVIELHAHFIGQIGKKEKTSKCISKYVTVFFFHDFSFSSSY